MMDDINDTVVIRPYVEADIKFIHNHWLYGFKQGCEYFRLIEDNCYKDIYGKVIHSIIERESTDIKIMCLKSDLDIIIGFSVTEIRQNQVILHWVYVKPDWRDNGLAAMLVSPEVTHTTHLTKTGRAILKKNPKVSFNPFLI